MRKQWILGVLLATATLAACTGKSPEAAPSPADIISKTQSEEIAIEEIQVQTESEEGLHIQVEGNGHTIVFDLNNSPAARNFYDQLPLTIQVEDYGGNEKIFYPPEKLETGDTPLTAGGEAGGLAYFASWGDVVMYYGNYGPYSGLYELGTAVSGSEWIKELSGEILIEQAAVQTKE